MTYQEWMTISQVLRALYPNNRAYLSAQDQIKVYYEMLKDLPSELVKACVLKHASTNKFPPTVAELRDQIGFGDLAINGWGQVQKAFRIYGHWREQEALDSLDPTTRRVVESLGWQNLCLSENTIADRAQFIKAYTELAERERNEKMLPAELREALNNALGFRQITGGKI